MSSVADQTTHAFGGRGLDAGDLAMMLEALAGSVVPFEDAIIRARPHPGALAAAAHLRDLLAESAINVAQVPALKYAIPSATRNARR